MSDATARGERQASARGAHARRTPGHRAVVGLAVSALAACSSPPPVEDVIPRGRVPQGDTWCRMLTTEQVETLLGDGDMDRVRQVGDLTPDSGVSPNCDVVWADEHMQENIVTAFSGETSGGGRYYLDALDNLGGLLGPGGERLSSGEVEQLEPGVYLSGEQGSLSVYLACEAGEDLPAVLRSGLHLGPTETGEQVTREEVVTLGKSLRDLTTWVHQCPGEVLPLDAADAELLIERARGVS